MVSSSPGLPTTEKPLPLASSVHPALYIVNWIVFSNVTILFNKWLLDTAGFKYPVLLTTWHLVFSSLATQILARTTSLLDSRHKLPINSRFYVRLIIPIGFLYSGSLVCSNLVYLYLSVAFTQMLKSSAPVAVLFFSWIWGVADPSVGKLVNIVVIVLGVALASAGEIEFSWLGFGFQVGGIVFEAMRLVMIQVMLSGEGLNMDPLVSLYYYAPVCAVMNALVSLTGEWQRFHWEDLVSTGWLVLLANALVAFLLNVASVSLIGKTSGLVMTLTGILKNIILVIASVIIWKTKITALQAFGYSIALSGLVYYSLGRTQLLLCFEMARAKISVVWSAPATEAGGISVRLRRIMVVGGVAIMAAYLVITSSRQSEQN